MLPYYRQRSRFAKQRAERIAWLKERYAQGATLEQVADELDIETTTLWQFCRKHQINVVPKATSPEGRAFGKRLAAARKQENLSTVELAIKAGVKQATIVAVEAGADADAKVLRRLAAVLPGFRDVKP